MGEGSTESLLDRYACRRGQPAAQILARQQADKTLQEALRVEPRLWAVLEQARKQRNKPGYSRAKTYVRLKQEWSLLVGHDAEKDAVATSAHYDAVLRAVDEWLPSDIGAFGLDRETLRAWREEAGIITYDCVHCGEPEDEAARCPYGRDCPHWHEPAPPEPWHDSIPFSAILEELKTEMQAQFEAALREQEKRNGQA